MEMTVLQAFTLEGCIPMKVERYTRDLKQFFLWKFPCNFYLGDGVSGEEATNPRMLMEAHRAHHYECEPKKHYVYASRSKWTEEEPTAELEWFKCECRVTDEDWEEAD